MNKNTPTPPGQPSAKEQQAALQAKLSAHVNDPLLDCMVILSKIKGYPLSHELLRAGTPLVDNKFTPTLMVRALKREGFNAKVSRRPLSKISKFTLPVILLLKNDKACILQGKNADGTYTVLFPDEVDQSATMSEQQLNKIYSGYSMLAQPKFQYEERSLNLHEIDNKSWLWRTLWKYRWLYFEVAIATLLVNIFQLVTPLFAMNVYDKVVPNQAYQTLTVLVIGVSIIYLLGFVIDTIREYFLDVVGKKADILLSSVLFQKVLNLQMEHRPKSVGAFASTIREFDSLRNFFSSATMTIFIDVPFTVVFLYVIWLIGGNIVWVPVAAIPVVIILALLHEMPISRTIQKMYAATSQKNATLIESLTGLETIKSLAAEGAMQRKYEHNVSIAAATGSKMALVSSLTKNVTKTILQFVYIIVIVIGVTKIGAGELTMGGLIAVSILSNRAIAPISRAAALLGKLEQTMTSYRALAKVMQLPSEREKGRQYISLPTLKGQIDFDKVTFTYPGDKKPVLEDISFRIRPGEKVAILGSNGCGKSTILKLMTNLYRPNDGSIRIDGIDTQHVNPSELRQNVGYCPQEYTLFYGTLRENIAFSAPWLGDENLLKVAEMCGIDKIISGHGGGYEMPINEQGLGISGGQRQSIALARTLFPNRNVLLLDEPTSSMDMTAETQIIDAMKDYCKDKTLILVTHRMKLLDLVDRVIVIEGGKIQYDGPKKK